MYNKPRTGDPFVSQQAMLYLMVSYFILCLPALLWKDGKLYDQYNIIDELDETKLKKVLVFLSIMTFLSFSYFLLDAIPALREFVVGGMNREKFREGVEMSHFSSPTVAVFAVFGTFSFASMFWGGVCLTSSFGNRLLCAMLIFGGFTYAVNMIKNAGRAGTFEAIMFLFTVCLVFWKMMSIARAKKVIRNLVALLLVILIPFLFITVTRFGEDADENGVIYSLVSYFATGPYSFNSDFTVLSGRNDMSCNGLITFALLPVAIDKLVGSELFVSGQKFMEELSDGLNEYVQINGSYSGEFKTVIGNLLCDYGAVLSMLILAALSIIVVAIFCSKKHPIMRYTIGVIYFYSVFMAPIGFGFGGRYRNLILYGLLIFNLFIAMKVRKRDRLP